MSLQLQLHTEPLTSFALKLTRDRDQAADLVQDTLLRALRNQDKFQDGTFLKAWLMTIMKNLFINRYHRQVRQRELYGEHGRRQAAELLGVEARVEAEANLDYAEMLEAIKHLDPEYRIPFQRYVDGYRYQEIAEYMELPLGTIKSRIFFARKRIQAHLAARGFSARSA